MKQHRFAGAFQSGIVVATDGGAGQTLVRRLADLILPTGRILIGYPGSPVINEVCPVRPEVAAGQYPVFASVVQPGSKTRYLAFVSVRFAPTAPATWQEIGSFFTDSGIGCLMDESCVALMKAMPGSAEDWNLLRQTKMGVFSSGNCSLILDAKSGANAIVFQTFDSRFPCALGTDGDGMPVCLVVDCR